MLVYNSLLERLCTIQKNFCRTKFLHDEENIMKTVCKPTCNNKTRCNDHILIEFSKRLKEYDSLVYLGVTIIELSKLHMYKYFYKLLEPKLKDL